MRRFFLATLSVLALSGDARAADLPMKSPHAQAAAMVDPVYNWSGFYVGLNAGGAWGRTETTSSPFGDNIGVTAAALAQAAGASASTGSGFIGGVKIGYNWQAANWVVGLEADVQGLNFKQTRTSLSFRQRRTVPKTSMRSSTVSSQHSEASGLRVGSFADLCHRWRGDHGFQLLSYPNMGLWRCLSNCCKWI